MPSKNKKHKYTAVDLFAGGGGLTVGLKQAGFAVVSAVEIQPNACLTYKKNHPEVRLFEKDIKKISGADLAKASPTGKIDLLAGCPPCQGFSTLTSKYKRIDPRNFLIREMGRLVEEIRPSVVMMENVPGLAQKGNVLLQAFIRKIEKLGYQVTYNVLQVADYGVPQSRRRLVLLAGHGFSIEIPKASHSSAPDKNQEPWVAVEKVLKGLPKPLALDAAHKKGGPEANDWHVVRVLSEKNVKRLKAAKPGKSWIRIPKHLRPDCHKDKTAGFPNVYGRMSWKQVSPTITGGCTTLSKGRFGHPSQQRTISVREAALLQTFPKDYVFATVHMEHACNIIGNALPCLFAKKLSSACIRKLKKIDKKKHLRKNKKKTA